jgi:hypothetical protein
MAKDGIKITGEFELILRGPDGRVKTRRRAKNLVVDAGLNLICSHLKESSAAVPSHMAIGTGSTTAAASDTTLVTECSGGSYARQALSSVLNTTNKTITYTNLFDANVGTGQIQEAGIFTASTAGTMLARVTFSSLQKDAVDTLTITHTITLAGS